MNCHSAWFAVVKATSLCFPPPHAGPGEEPKVFVGITEGRIVPARGPTTFGWDPVFEPEGFSEVRSDACVGLLGQGF